MTLLGRLRLRLLVIREERARRRRGRELARKIILVAGRAGATRTKKIGDLGSCRPFH